MSKRHAALLTPVKQLGSGSWAFDDYWTSGKRRQVIRTTEEKARKAYNDVAALVARGRKDLATLDGAELAEFRAWKARFDSTLRVEQVVTEFLAERKRDKDARAKWSRVVGDYLRMFSEEFGGEKLSAVTAPKIEAFLRSEPGWTPRTRNNVRAIVVQLFRWARGKRYLSDTTTEAERAKRFKVKKTGKITHWTPDELQTLLNAAEEDDRVWYLLGNLAGIRTEEMMPEYKDKDPLRWEDFDWLEGVIHLRMETSKVNEARNVSISDQLAHWLLPYRARKGPCVAIGRRPRVITRHLEASTGIKHRVNANRHSYGTYRRMEVTKIEVVAEEMGTSIYLVKTNYSRPINQSALNAWKAVLPVDNAKIIALPKSLQVLHKKKRSRLPMKANIVPSYHR